jgi:hypothetical protein
MYLAFQAPRRGVPNVSPEANASLLQILLHLVYKGFIHAAVGDEEG